jgi:Family of unknown function (DUF5947)
VSTGLRRFVPGAEEAPAPAAAAAPLPETPATPAAQTTPATAATPAGQTEEKCEFCAAAIAAEHGHVADLESSSLMCACRPCYLLFTHSGAGQTRQQEPEPGGDGERGQQRQIGRARQQEPEPGGDGERGQQRQVGRARYRAVPDRYRSDAGHPLTVAEWDALEIPVGLAFFLRRSAGGDTTAFYPSPAGATECRLDLEAWARIAAGHPLLTAAADDVEAILISRGGQDQETAVTFLVPIDACYELAGRMRLLWRGFDGGAEARDAVSSFLGRVRERAVDLGQEP